MEKTNEKEKEFRFETHGPKYIFRGPKIEWGIIVLRKGDELGAHYHKEVEETFYFLEGSGIMKIGDTEYTIEKGDAFRIEANEIHNIIAKSEIRVIFIKCPFLPEDKVNV